MHGDFIMCPTVCYRRSRLPAERFRADWRMVLDLDFFTRILLGGGTMVGLPSCRVRLPPARRRTRRPSTPKACLRFEEESRLARPGRRGGPRPRLADRSPASRRGSASSNSTCCFASLRTLPACGCGPAGRKWSFLYGLFWSSGNKTESRGIS